MFWSERNSALPAALHHTPHPPSPPSPDGPENPGLDARILSCYPCWHRLGEAMPQGKRTYGTGSLPPRENRPCEIRQQCQRSKTAALHCLPSSAAGRGRQWNRHISVHATGAACDGRQQRCVGIWHGACTHNQTMRIHAWMRIGNGRPAPEDRPVALHSSRHAPALLCAATASLSAALAMVMLVLAAFRRTRIADFCTEQTRLPGELAAPRHHASRETADCSAIHVKCDTARHHAAVFILQAAGSATIAGVSALVARIDARLMCLVSHF